MQHGRPHWRRWWSRLATATVAATTLATTAGSPIRGGDGQSPFAWMAGPALSQEGEATARAVQPAPQVPQHVARIQQAIPPAPRNETPSAPDLYGSSAWSPELGTQPLPQPALSPQLQYGSSPWPMADSAAQGAPQLNGRGLAHTQPLSRQPVSLPATKPQGSLPWADDATIPGDAAPVTLPPSGQALHQGTNPLMAGLPQGAVPPAAVQAANVVPGIQPPLSALNTAPPQMAPSFPAPAVLPWQRATSNAATAPSDVPPTTTPPMTVVPSEMGAKVAAPLAIVPPTGSDALAPGPDPVVPTPAVPTPAVPTNPQPVVPQPAVPEPSVPDPAIAEPKITAPAITEPTITEPAVAEPTPAQPAVPPTTSALVGPATSQAGGATASEPALSPQVLDMVSRQAIQHVSKGFELADRRMFYSARKEFHRALEVIAQALDMHEATPRHTTALVNGLRALDEAADFQSRALDVDRDVRQIAASHRTPVLHALTEPISPLAAAQQYYGYAQEQLALAVKPLQAGSAALSALGKLNDELAREETTFVANPLARVKVFHQAALLVDQKNWQAANELAVFLARNGNYEQARGWLQHSIAVAPQPENWHNLACLHAVLGEQREAQLAQAQARRLAGIEASGQPASITSRVDVQWVDPEQFARLGSNLPLESMPPGGAPAAPSAANQTAQTATAAKPGEEAPATATHPAGGPTAPRAWNWFPWKR